MDRYWKIKSVNNMAIEEAALFYCADGYSIFPTCGKVPLAGWKGGYKVNNKDVSVITKWWNINPGSNIGLVTGEINHLFVVDLDPRNYIESQMEKIMQIQEICNDEETLMVTTPSGGTHYYFHYSLSKYGDIKCGSNVSGINGFDVKCNGGYVIAPPSVVKGKKYFLHPFETIKSIPNYILDLLRLHPRIKSFKNKETGQVSLVAPGERHSFIFSEAVQVFKRTGDPVTTAKYLDILNKTKLTEALPEKEINQIINSVSQYTKYSFTPDAYTDIGTAKAICNINKSEFYFAPEINRFLYWDGKRYSKIDSPKIYTFIDDYAEYLKEKMYKEEKEIAIPALKWSLHLKSRNGVDNIVSAIKHEESITKSLKEFDTDSGLINCQNGVYNFATGEIYKHDKKYMCTMLTSANYVDDEAPIFNKFIKEIFEDEELRLSVLRNFGYGMTGFTKEQQFYILYGLGANGKSTLMRNYLDILGDYAKTSSPDTFVSKKPTNANNDLARLWRSRVVCAFETEIGGKLNEILIKQITGGDILTARFLYCEFFEFAPGFKLFIISNHKPFVHAGEHSIWRRISMIPFIKNFDKSEMIKDLPEMLWQERDAIFSIYCREAGAYIKSGLLSSRISEAYWNDYRDERDAVRTWFGFNYKIINDTDFIICEPILFADMYAKFTSYVETSGLQICSKKMFSLCLGDYGCRKIRTAKGIYYVNLDPIGGE